MKSLLVHKKNLLWSVLLTLLCVMLATGTVSAQNIYQSVASGNWSNTATWQESTDGGNTWVTPVTYLPGTAVSDIVWIMDGYVDSLDGGMTSPVSIGQLNIGTGTSGELDFAAGTVNPTMKLQVGGNVTVASGASFNCRPDTLHVDTLALTGNLTVNGTVNFARFPVTVPALGYPRAAVLFNNITGPQYVSGTPTLLRLGGLDLQKGATLNKVEATCSVQLGYDTIPVTAPSTSSTALMVGGPAIGTWEQNAGTFRAERAFTCGIWTEFRLSGSGRFVDRSYGAVTFNGPLMINTTDTLYASYGSYDLYTDGPDTLQAGTIMCYGTYNNETYTTGAEGNFLMTGGTFNIYGQGATKLSAATGATGNGNNTGGYYGFKLTAGESFRQTGGAINIINMNATPSSSGGDVFIGTHLTAPHSGLSSSFSGGTFTIGDPQGIDTASGQMGFVIRDSGGVAFGNLVIAGGSGGGATPGPRGRRTIIYGNAGATTVTAANLTVNSGSVLDDSIFTMKVTGNITNNGTITGNSSAESVTLSGGSAQHQLSGAGTYNDLVLNDTYGAELTGSPTMTGNLTVTAGEFTPNGNTLTGTGSNTITLGSTGTLDVDQSTLAGDYVSFNGAVTANTGSTVKYVTGSQSVSSSFTYSNLTLNNSAGASLTGTTTVGGNLNLANGALSAGANTLNLSGTGTVVTVGSGSFSAGTGTVNYTGASATTVAPLTYNNLNLNGATTYTAGGTSFANDVTVAAGATFNPSSYLMTGTGTTPSFNLNGTLNINTTTFAGNLTGFSTYAFNSGSNVAYKGASQTVEGLTYYNLTLNGSGTTSQDGDVSVTNTLTLTAGTYGIGAHALTLANPIAGTPSNLASGSTSNLTLNGSGAAFTIPASVSTLNNYSQTYANGVSLAGPLSVGTLTLTSGTLNDNGYTLTVGGAVTNNSSETGTGEILLSSGDRVPDKAGSKTIKSATQHPITGTGSYNNLELSDAGNAEILSGVSTVNGTLTLTAGEMFGSANMTLGNGVTIVRNAGALDAAPTFGTSLNLSYTGSTPATTGYELPTIDTVLQNLTVNNSGGVTLGANATVNNTLTLTSGTFAIGANTLSISKAIVGTTTNLSGGSTSSLSIEGTGSGITVPSSVTSLNNLTLNNPNGATLGASMNIIDGTALTALGQINTGANTLNLGTGGMLVEAGYGAIVYGNVQATGTPGGGSQLLAKGSARSIAAANAKNKSKKLQDLYTFGGIGFSIDPNSGASPGLTTVTRVTGVSKTAAGATGIKRYYTVNPASESGLNANIVFGWDSTASELTGGIVSLNPDSLTLFSSPTGSAPWTAWPASYDHDSADGHYISVSGVTNLSTWTASDVEHPLATTSDTTSDVVAVPGSESATVSSITNDPSPLTTLTGTQVWRVVVRDNPTGLVSPDDKSTTLANITITQGAGNQVGTWSNAILAADLFDGTGHLASGTIQPTSIVFTNVNAVAPANGNDTLSLRISLKNPLGYGVADDQHFDFAVTNANVAGGSSLTNSQFGSFPAISSNNTQNEISVVATQLVFSLEPPSTSPDYTNFSSQVSGTDANGNVSYEFTDGVMIGVQTGTGSISSVAGLTKTAVNGTASWTDLQYNKVENPVILSGTDMGSHNVATVKQALKKIAQVTSATSTAINFTQRVDTLSDVIANGGEATTISSIINNPSPLSSGQGTEVWSVLVRDGGASGDFDHLPTILTSLTITKDAANTVASWANAIQAAELFDGSTALASGTLSSNSITFTGFTDTTASGGTKALTVRITLQNPLGTGITADQKFVFDVTAGNVTAAGGSTSSLFSPSFATASSNPADNAIQVLASKLVFISSEGNVHPGDNISATVNATDVNGNLDIDFDSVVTFSVASLPGVLKGTNLTPRAVSGVASSSTLQVDTSGTFALQASSGVLTPGVSNSFVVSTITRWKVANITKYPLAAVDTLNWDSSSTWVLVAGTTTDHHPHYADQVIIDNTNKSGSYVVEAGTSPTITDSAAQITIGPGTSGTVTLLIPNLGSTQNTPSLYFGNATAGDYDMDIQSNGVFQNSVGLVALTSNNIYYGSTADSIRIQRGGMLIENNLMNQTFLKLMTHALDGNYGTVVYDVPQITPSNAYDVNCNGTPPYYFPNLTFKSTHNANLTNPYILYNSGGSPMRVKGDLTISTGAYDSIGIGSDEMIYVYGNVINNGRLTVCTSPLMMGGTQSQSICGNPVTLGDGLIPLDSVYLRTDVSVSGGAVTTSGQVVWNATTDTTYPTGVVTTVADTMNLNPAGSLVEIAANYPANPVQGVVSATRSAAQGTDQAFGSIGYDINAAGGAPGTTTVTRTTGTALTGYKSHQSIKRYYDVTAANSVGLNATTGFAYAPQELNNIVESTLLLHKSTNGGSTWSAKSGSINTNTHVITASSVPSVAARWTAASDTAPLFQPDTITIAKLTDADGNIFTTGDEAPIKWKLSLYQDSVTAGTLVNSGNLNTGRLVTTGLAAGTYIAVEQDSTSTGWIRLGKIHHGTRETTNTGYDTLVMTAGEQDSTVFINQHVSSITLVKLLTTSGSAAGATPKNWTLKLYSGTVSEGTLIDSANTSSLTATSLPAGKYIGVEADSGASWNRINGNGTRYDTLSLLASQSVADTFINFQPNHITIINQQDTDGVFSTTTDRAQRAWHLELRQDSVNGALIASSETGRLDVRNLGNGNYYAVEPDSAGWVRLGYNVQSGAVLHVQGDVFVPVNVPVSGGKSVTVTFVNASPSYAAKYRTISPDSVEATLIKGKIAPVAQKTSQYSFSVSLVTSAVKTNGLVVEFSAPVDTAEPFTVDLVHEGLTTSEIDVVVWTIKVGTATITFNDTLAAGDTITITGYSAKAPKLSQYQFTFQGALIGQTQKKNLPVVATTPRLPMPNRVNALEALFPKTPTAFPNGLIVGLDNLNAKEFGWMDCGKYTDVISSLYDKTGPQNGTPRGFDSTTAGKPLVGEQKSLPPSKYNDILIADLTLLQINIEASAYDITPSGFGNLIYRDTSADTSVNVNGMTVTEIANAANVWMMGTINGTIIVNKKTVPVHQFISAAGFARLHQVVSNINNAFEGTLDTISWGASGLQFTGTKTLAAVPFLHANPAGVAPKVVAKEKPEAVVPTAYKLYQNFPNPFNPTTTIQFDLPMQSIVTLKVYNILGQEVTTLFDHAQLNGGTQMAQFNAGNYASGVYFYRLIATPVASSNAAAVREYTQVNKMLLIK
jgi:hypothetical protein